MFTASVPPASVSALTAGMRIPRPDESFKLKTAPVFPVPPSATYMLAFDGSYVIGGNVLTSPPLTEIENWVVSACGVSAS